MFGENEVAVRFIFNSASFNTTIGQHHSQADSGYKFLVLKVSVKNLGDREVQTYIIGDKWEVTVDKGYVYEEVPFISFVVQTTAFTLRPEEEKVGYVVFEILNDVDPPQSKLLQASRPVGVCLVVWFA